MLQTPSRGTQSAPWTTEDCRDAVVALYIGEVLPRDIPKRFHGVSRQRVEELVAALPSELVNNELRLTLTRAANRVTGYVATDRPYTDWELREALKASYAKEMSRPVIENVFGVPPGTSKRKLKLYEMRVLGKDRRDPMPSVTEFSSEVDGMAIAPLGR